MESKKHWVALNMVLGVGKTLFHRLVRGFGSPAQVFGTNKDDLMRVEGIGAKVAGEILNFDVDRNAEREFRLAEKIFARVLTLNCSEYPELLKTIYDPPPVIYVKGKDLRSFPVPIAVVGTRAATNYGKLVAEKLCGGGLATLGVCVVSGMARGIDTMAHRAALESGGGTLAVFGCGLGHTYPPENRGLREKIEAHGAVLSEFPVNKGPERNNFPARNRIISGLSHGTVVIEVGEKSGALITSQFALEQGREVFAVPGGETSFPARVWRRTG
jgi:DNA processing protein